MEAAKVNHAEIWHNYVNYQNTNREGGWVTHRGGVDDTNL